MQQGVRMNFRVLFILLFYWSIWLIIVATAGSTVLGGSGFSTTGGNITQFTSDTSMINSTGIFGIVGGLSGIGDYALFALFGIGFTAAPVWFAVMFMVWQSMITIITVGFIISMVWNG